jgi:hypothetical protein
MEHEVSGRVVVQETRIPLSGVTVDVWQKSVMMDRHLASLETGVDGSFATRVSGGLLARWMKQEVYLRIWNGEDHELYNGVERPRGLRRMREDIEVGIPLRDLVSEHAASLIVEVQPRVTGKVAYLDSLGRTIPEWSDRHRDAVEGLTVQLWDADRQVRLAVEPAARARYVLWFSTTLFPRVKHVQVKVVSRGGPALYVGPVMQWCRETIAQDLSVTCSA